MNPNKMSITQTTDIKGTGPKTEKSCPVMNKKIAPKMDKKIQTVCILCNILIKMRSKNSNNFLDYSKISVDLQDNLFLNSSAAWLNYFIYTFL